VERRPGSYAHARPGPPFDFSGDQSPDAPVLVEFVNQPVAGQEAVDVVAQLLSARLTVLAQAHGFTPHIRTRGEEIREKARTPGWRARRWIVEAAHSWLNRNRALLIRWSKKDENHLALLHLASGLIAFKKARAATAEAALSG
jgi:hypothetical protein